ncbi:Fructose-bisphosphate aldolase class 1 [compost metagenome]
MSLQTLNEVLGDNAEFLLNHQPKVSKETLHLPGPDFVDRMFSGSNRSNQVLRNIQTLYGHGR